MVKQFETITCVQCPICGVKILETWTTYEKPSELEIAKYNEKSRERHIELHENNEKYFRLKGLVREMGEITGDLKYDT